MFKKRKKNKYGAVKTKVDGILFDSKAEASRYMVLVLLERQGEIQRLELQPKFDCIVNSKKICSYRADFRYFTNRGVVVEDVKGMKTPVYRIKKKLVEALYPGVKIQEVQ